MEKKTSSNYKSFKMQMKEMLSATSATTAATTRTSTSSSLDAAALQLDISQKYKLTSGSNKVKATRSNNRDREQGTVCLSCHSSNVHRNICNTCGYVNQQAPSLSLSQQRGLSVIPTQAPLSTDAWMVIESKIKNRSDICCPICMESFKNGFEILLSCSHIYHRNCLQSFEQFMKTNERLCPICRTGNYQKKVTNVGSKAYELSCVLMIQRNWRGYYCRNKYHTQLRAIALHTRGGNSSQFKKQFFEKQLKHYSNEMENKLSRLHDEADDVCISIHDTLAESKRLDKEFENMLEKRNAASATLLPAYHSHQLIAPAEEKENAVALIQKKWKDTLLLLVSRCEGFGECAICMCQVRKGTRRIVLLSCAHAFHVNCFNVYENFVSRSTGDLVCPICRRGYEKVLLSESLTEVEREL